MSGKALRRLRSGNGGGKHLLQQFTRIHDRAHWDFFVVTQASISILVAIRSINFMNNADLNQRATVTTGQAEKKRPTISKVRKSAKMHRICSALGYHHENSHLAIAPCFS
jgi:hypothetical protein